MYPGTKKPKAKSANRYRFNFGFGFFQKKLAIFFNSLVTMMLGTWASLLLTRSGALF
jgi:hypothetical protein